MIDVAQLLAFSVAAVLITATPGPDNLMVLCVALSRGRRHGVAFGLGCAVGCLCHTALAVMGVSALVAASPAAFMALKWAGGAYLIWLGVKSLRTAGASAPVSVGEDALASSRELFFKGMVANTINPKVVLFFLSFVPQFIVPGQGDIALQFGLLGLTFAAQAAVAFTLLAHFAGSIGSWMYRTPRADVWLDRIAGTVFVGLGVRMVTTR